MATTTMTATSFAATALTNNRYYIYLSNNILPLSKELWHRLDVPEYNI